MSDYVDFVISLISFITPDEVSNMIAEREKKAGVTAEIKEGPEIKWDNLSGTLFSDYVKK